MTPIDLPKGGKLDLRPVTKEDEPFLVALYGSTREAELSQVEWQEGQRDVFVRWQFEMLIDGEPAGRFWVGEDDEEIRLLDIALLPQFQKRGVGTILLRELMKEADGAGKRLRHMVFVLNDNAHRFYERLGFVVIEDVGAYKHMEYRNQGQDAGADGR